MKLVSLITKDPSNRGIGTAIEAAREALPDEMSVAAEIELIASAIGTVQLGIKDKLHSCLENMVGS